MAKINEQTLHIKLSQLLKDSDLEAEILSHDDLALLEEAIKSMVSDTVLIEVS